mmetsp:Transcript_7313/g.13176  ORF Transcript_7313/g.13176 Transcript_7313/m.13176 type:complete len:80 (-) Transcript_7313:90-329(-)
MVRGRYSTTEAHRLEYIHSRRVRLGRYKHFHIKPLQKRISYLASERDGAREIFNNGSTEIGVCSLKESSIGKISITSGY